MTTHVPKRIYKDEALRLYRHSSLHELAQTAHTITTSLHPQPIRSYVIERNINYTNVCITRCSFCGFSVPPNHKNAYVLSQEQLHNKITELIKLGGTQILLQGGMNPNLELNWYCEMLKWIKTNFPTLHIHAFSPPEIAFLSKKSGKTTQKVLKILQKSGLNSLPGGGAEILCDRVRKLISPVKCTTNEWLTIMQQAHEIGMSTTATMMFGHLETPAEKIEHLDKIRNLQDKSLNQRQKNGFGGIFTAFTCWPFQPGHTRLSRWNNRNHAPAKIDPKKPAPPQNPQSPQLQLAGPLEYLRMTALARIYLDNIDNIQASWVTQGPEIAQLSLIAGANDAGSLMIEENVVSSVGTTYNLKLEQLRNLIRTAGFTPQQRNYYYEPV